MRTPTEDRAHVTSKNGPVVAVRLTPNEDRALTAMVQSAQRQAEAMGLPLTVTAAGLVRVWLREKAIAAGCWEGAVPAAAPGPPPTQATQERQLEVEGLLRREVGHTALASPTQAPAPAPLTAESVQARVRAACEAGATSQRALASAIGWNQGGISRFVTGAAAITDERVVALGDELRRLGY